MKQPEAEAMQEEISNYRATNGQVQLTVMRTRPDGVVPQNLAAEKVSKATVVDAIVISQKSTQ